MAALSAARNTVKRATLAREVPTDYGQLTNTVIYAGALVALTAAGYLTPGAAATTLKPVGRANETKDATGIASGAQTVSVEAGIFAWANSSAGDAITIADIGNVCYIVDDQTVAKTDGSGARSAAGIVFDVDSDGVWVDMSTTNRRS
jgi:hypothetical protein